ncbi:MAG: site-specific integrase [Elainella sp.]
MAMGRFDWGRYIKVKSAAPQTAAAWVEAFEADYFTRRARTPESQTTWDKDYRDVFRKLPDGPLTAEVILKLIASTAPDTRSRKRFCGALGALARFAGIPIDVKPLRGSYSPKAVQPRDLPSDAMVIEWRDRIPDEAWKWVYSVMAAYGLRPHECWHISPESVSSGPKVEVLRGKTGRRVVWPYMPDWWEDWQLSKMQLPNVTAKCNRDYGLRAQQYFRRLGLPFPLYNLRHAWAARAAREGLENAEAARMQGHGSDVHESIYQRFMGEEATEAAWERTRRRGAKGDA